VKWANEWQLTININKCSVLPLSPAVHSLLYGNNGIAIPYQNSYLDLGATIDNKLSFEAHISNIVSKARGSVLVILFLTSLLVTCISCVRHLLLTYALSLSIIAFCGIPA
jgi:hypothetical protein